MQKLNPYHATVILPFGRGSFPVHPNVYLFDFFNQGPSHEAMWALGDKIASTILAQSAGVPTVPWSGSRKLIIQNSFISK